jgi:hypothetical protein
MPEQLLDWSSEPYCRKTTTGILDGNVGLGLNAAQVECCVWLLSRRTHLITIIFAYRYNLYQFSTTKPLLWKSQRRHLKVILFFLRLLHCVSIPRRPHSYLPSCFFVAASVLAFVRSPGSKYAVTHPLVLPRKCGSMESFIWIVIIFQYCNYGIVASIRYATKAFSGGSKTLIS